MKIELFAHLVNLNQTPISRAARGPKYNGTLIMVVFTTQDLV